MHCLLGGWWNSLDGLASPIDFAFPHPYLVPMVVPITWWKVLHFPSVLYSPRRTPCIHLRHTSLCIPHRIITLLKPAIYVPALGQYSILFILHSSSSYVTCISLRIIPLLKSAIYAPVLGQYVILLLSLVAMGCLFYICGLT